MHTGPVYSAPLPRSTTSTTLGVGAIQQPGSGMRRAFVHYAAFSSASTGADNQLQFRLQRSSGGSLAGTSVTPSPADSADAASALSAYHTLTNNDSLGVSLYDLACHQRATVQWHAPPGGALVLPATADVSLVALTPVAQNTPQATVVLAWIE